MKSRTFKNKSKTVRPFEIRIPLKPENCRRVTQSFVHVFTKAASDDDAVGLNHCITNMHLNEQTGFEPCPIWAFTKGLKL